MLLAVVVAAIASTLLIRRPEPIDARVTIESDRESIRNICAQLSAASHVPIEVHPDVGQSVLIHVHGVPWRDVLDAVVETAGHCKVEDDGCRLRVMPSRTAPLAMTREDEGWRATKPPAPFHICVHDARVNDVVAEFRRLVPTIRFELDENGWPDDYRIPRFEVSAASWREALDAFYERHEAEWEQDGPSSVRISRPPRVTFGASEGPIDKGVELIARLTGANVCMSEDVRGTVRNRWVRNLSWRQLLEVAVVRSGPFVIVERSGIYRIAPGTVEGIERIPGKLRDLGLRGRREDDRLIALVERLQHDSTMEQRLAEIALVETGPAAAGVLHRAWEEARTTDLRIRLARITERIWSARR